MSIASIVCFDVKYLVGAEASFPLDGADGSLPLLLALALARLPILLLLPDEVADVRVAALLLLLLLLKFGWLWDWGTIGGLCDDCWVKVWS